MKRVAIATLITVACSTGYGALPDANVVKSCLLADSINASVAVRSLNADEIVQQGNYDVGLDAPFTFKDQGVEVGYAESKADQALIYSRKLYRLSKAERLSGNHDFKPVAFNPLLAEWSIGREGTRQYFCVSVNFDGLGRSGTFQNVRAGYLLDTKTRRLYFVVRDVRQ